MQERPIEDIHDSKWIGEKIRNRNWPNLNKCLKVKFVGDRYILGVSEGEEVLFDLGDLSAWVEVTPFPFKEGDSVRGKDWDIGEYETITKIYHSEERLLCKDAHGNIGIYEEMYKHICKYPERYELYVREQCLLIPANTSIKLEGGVYAWTVTDMLEFKPKTLEPTSITDRLTVKIKT